MQTRIGLYKMSREQVDEVVDQKQYSQCKFELRFISGNL